MKKDNTPKAFLYVLGASTNPDKVERSVPCPISENEIFFGPCMPDMRKKLADEYIWNEKNIETNPVYVVGFNGLSRKYGKKRKIVWCGKVINVMTFEDAYKKLKKNSRYGFLFRKNDSPLQFEPIYQKDKFDGYEHWSELHEDEWEKDLARPIKKIRYVSKGNEVRIRDGFSRKEAFPRDCCLLLKTIFYATNGGIEIDDDILEVLKKGIERDGIDKVAVFGTTGKGEIYGSRGKHIEIEGKIARLLIEKIEEKKPKFDVLPVIKKLKTENCKSCGSRSANRRKKPNNAC